MEYEVVAVRVLWDQPDFNDMHEKRIALEAAIKGIAEVAIIVSCITAFEERKKKNDDGDDDDDVEVKTGFAFWVAFKWPEYMLERFEDELCRIIIPIGVDIASFKSLRTRGIFYSML